jgi:hypothetical protein
MDLELAMDRNLLLSTPSSSTVTKRPDTKT